MKKPTLRAVTLGLIVAAAVLPTACYVEDDYPPVAYGYAPAYYGGALVYYDGYGHPFYYDHGAAVWIGPGAPGYAGLVSHWHRYGGYYGTWNAHYGARYRGYRGHR